MNHVKACINNLCLANMLRKQSKLNSTICKQYLPVSYKFGCPQSSSIITKKKKKKKKIHHRITSWKKRFRRPKRKSQKPRFFKKREKHSYSKKPTTKVKCFGCQQIGHYANKCPNKPKFSAKVQSISEEFGLILADDYDSECFSETQSFYETDSNYSSSSDSSSE